MSSLSLGTLDADTLILDPREAALRLGCPPEAIASAPSALAKVTAAIRCRYVYCRLPVTRPKEDVIDLGFGPLASHALFRNLQGCEEAFLFALTLGSDVDRLLLKLAKLSGAEHFIADALASALTETACDLAEERICGTLRHRPRFSPGYGDLSLSVQPAVLAALDAERKLGITLTQALLMSPMKSVTAIVGILS